MSSQTIKPDRVFQLIKVLIPAAMTVAFGFTIWALLTTTREYKGY